MHMSNSAIQVTINRKNKRGSRMTLGYIVGKSKYENYRHCGFDSK